MACISEITVILIGNYRALEMFLIMIECYSSSQPVCSSDVFIYMSRPGAGELSVLYTFPFPFAVLHKTKVWISAVGPRSFDLSLCLTVFI